MTRSQSARLRQDLALAYLGALKVDEAKLAVVINRHVAQVLAATDGNLSLAAKLLGMHRRSLQRYVRRKQRRRRRRVRKSS